MDTISDLHPLTMEIKKYFADNPENDFLRRLGALRKIEGIETYPEDPEDDMVMLTFDEKNMSIQSVTFLDGEASVTYECDGYSVDINFDFSGKTKSLKTLPTGYLLSSFNNYEKKGKEALFEDILFVMENIIARKVYLEYMPCKPRGNLIQKRLGNIMAESEESEEAKVKIKSVYDDIYKRNKKGSEFLTKARVFIIPDRTVAVSNRWKDKYGKNIKLKSMQL